MTIAADGVCSPKTTMRSALRNQRSPARSENMCRDLAMKRPSSRVLNAMAGRQAIAIGVRRGQLEAFRSSSSVWRREHDWHHDSTFTKAQALMTQTNHDPSKPPIHRELSLDELDHVAGGAGGWLNAPGNFVNGFAGGAIYGTGAKDSQIAMFGDRNDIGFRPGVETGMMLNMALGPVGSLMSNGANAVASGVSAVVSGVGNAYQAAHDYLNPSPGNGAPGDGYLPAHMGSDGAVVPGQFVAPGSAPQGADHSADHTEQSAPSGTEPSGGNDHAGEQALSGSSDTSGAHSGDNPGNDHSGSELNGNDFNGSDSGGTQFAGADYGGGDYGGGDFGGSDFG